MRSGTIRLFGHAPWRRCSLPLMLVFAALATTGIKPITREQSLLYRAIARAGGVSALESAQILAWTGDATVFAGDRRVEISVDTWVQPFVSAHSTSWLRAQGRTSARTMEIDAKGGF